MPVGVPAPVPAVLLLHGYGEDRAVWNAFYPRVAERGWAVMALDLRGHGESKTKNQRPIQATQEWRTSLHEFRSISIPPSTGSSSTANQQQQDVVIGSDVGANLALTRAAGFRKFVRLSRSSPSEREPCHGGSAQDFKPKSALIIVADEAEGNRVKAAVANPSRVQVVPFPAAHRSGLPTSASRCRVSVVKETF